MALDTSDLIRAKNSLDNALDSLRVVINKLTVDTIDNTGSGINSVQEAVKNKENDIKTEKDNIDSVIGLASDSIFNS